MSEGSSNWNESRGTVPSRWLHCPRKAMKLIQNKFLAFKTPLSSAFDSQVPEECRFNINMLFTYLKSQKLKLGLWVDLTNTTRFYDRKCIEENGCKYLKLQCRGHGETPSEEQTRIFIQICKNFIAHNPLDIIGVHCTHGFNRTGFLIISYLVETNNMSVDAGLAEFAIVRPPGIYKGDYIQELYRRYDDVQDAPPPPPRPLWCLEDDEASAEKNEGETGNGAYDEGSCNAGKKHEYHTKDPVFMAGVPGVTPIQNKSRLSKVQRRIQEICGWKSTGFPGSQPVSMDIDNIRKLHEKPYRVSWKADGTRYMMLIQGDGEIYFADRNYSIFEVHGLKFPHPRDVTRCLRDTLLDGEMVIDKDKANDMSIPRYLVYDVIMYDGQDVSKLSFHPDRYSIIEKHIIAGRQRAMMERRLLKEREPFSVRLKYFWDIALSESLLSEKFANQLGHEPDGLIFQPSKEMYCTGVSPEVLKWKPLSLNSVDFRLKIVTESGVGIVPRKIGQLYVGGLKVPYGTMKLTKDHKKLKDNAIIECKVENGQWVYMREREDKKYPNSLSTAESVCKSISTPVTQERLLDFILTYRFPQDDSELMPPPRKKTRTC